MRLTERETIQYLQNAPERYAPLRISRLESQVSSSEGHHVDAIIEFSIEDGPSFEALIEEENGIKIVNQDLCQNAIFHNTLDISIFPDINDQGR